MTFGQRVRQLRTTRNLTLRTVAAQVGIDFTYLSKIENGRLDHGGQPSDGLIRRLADALGGDTDELLLMAGKVPEQIRRRLMARPDAFRRLALLDDRSLDRLMAYLCRTEQMRL